jgi:hypothetical protein
MNLRKKDLELTIDDITKYPVWEYAYGEGGQEIKLKPSIGKAPYDISINRYLVRAIFLLNNGRKECGYIKPINLKDNFMGHLPCVDLNYVMLTRFGNIFFWFGSNKPKRRIVNKFYKWLNLQSSDIFPIHVKSDVEIINGLAEGIIDGFLYCNNDEVEDYYHMKASEIKIMY